MTKFKKKMENKKLQFFYNEDFSHAVKFEV